MARIGGHQVHHPAEGLLDGQVDAVVVVDADDLYLDLLALGQQIVNIIDIGIRNL